VTGPYCGPASLLYIPMVSTIWALLALIGYWNAVTAVATALAMIAGAWQVRRILAIAVDEFGVRYEFASTRLAGSDAALDIPWDNIQSIDGHWLFGSIVFKHPQKVGARTKTSVSISFLDPKWRNRPTTQAIVYHLNHPWE